MQSNRKRPAWCEACVLAGGLSARMGRDKGSLRLGGRTLLAHVKTAVAPFELRTRIIRRDLMPRCGPLGGVYTALKTTDAERVLFLSCDMPFVPRELMQRLLAALGPKTEGVFVFHRGVAGFPFVLRAETIGWVEELLRARQLALQQLACKLKARAVRPARAEAALMLNVNTPEDWIAARKLWQRLRSEN